MRSILITVLLSGVVLLGVSSCATVPKEPLTSGEVRLLSKDVLGSGIEANSSFAVNIFFRQPSIRNWQLNKFFEGCIFLLTI